MAILDPPALLARAIILATAVATARGYTPVDTVAAICNIGALQRLLDVRNYSLLDTVIVLLLVFVIANLLLLDDNTADRTVVKHATRAYNTYIRPRVVVVLSKITADPPKSFAVVITLGLAWLSLVLVRMLYRACTIANIVYVGYDLPVDFLETAYYLSRDYIRIISRLLRSVLWRTLDLVFDAVTKSVNSACNSLLKLLYPAYYPLLDRGVGDEFFWKHPLNRIFVDFVYALDRSRYARDLNRLAVVAILVFWLRDMAKACWNLLLCAATSTLHPLWLNDLVDSLERDPKQTDPVSARGPKVRTLSRRERFYIAFAPWVARVFFTHVSMNYLTYYQTSVWPLLYVAMRVEIIDRGRWLFWLPKLALNLVCAVVPTAWEACITSPLRAAYALAESAVLVALGVASIVLLVFLRVTRTVLIAVSTACAHGQRFLYDRCPSAAELEHAYRKACTFLRTLKRKCRIPVMAYARARVRATSDALADLDPTVPLTDRERQSGILHILAGRISHAIPYLMVYILLGMLRRRLSAEQQRRKQNLIDLMVLIDRILWRPWRAGGSDFRSIYDYARQTLVALKNGKMPGWFWLFRDSRQLAQRVAWWDHFSNELIALLSAAIDAITEADLVEDLADARALNVSAWYEQKLIALMSLLAELVDDGKLVPPHVNPEEQRKAMADPSNPAFCYTPWRWVERPVPISLRKRLAYNLRNIQPPTYLVDTLAWPSQ